MIRKVISTFVYHDIGPQNKLRVFLEKKNQFNLHLPTGSCNLFTIYLQNTLLLNHTYIFIYVFIIFEVIFISITSYQKHVILNKAVEGIINSGNYSFANVLKIN